MLNKGFGAYRDLNILNKCCIQCSHKNSICGDLSRSFWIFFWLSAPCKYWKDFATATIKPKGCISNEIKYRRIHRRNQGGCPPPNRLATNDRFVTTTAIGFWVPVSSLVFILTADREDFFLFFFFFFLVVTLFSGQIQLLSREHLFFVVF